MEITILLFLIQPILFIWILFKAIKNINKIVLNSNQKSMFEHDEWDALTIITTWIIPIIGFLVNYGEQRYHHPDSWGDDMFCLFAPKYISEMALFYFISVAILYLGNYFGKKQLWLLHASNAMLVLIITISTLATIQLGSMGLLLTATPILGFLLFVPFLNIILLVRMYLIKLKGIESLAQNTLIAFGIAIVYAALFQFILHQLGFKEFGLIKAFTQSKDGFIPKIITNIFN